MFSSVLAALAVLVLAVQLARAEAADAPPHEHKLKRLKNLVDECAFTVAGTSFDLCPVVNGNEVGWTVKTERRTPPTVTATEYRIDLKAPLKKDGEVPGHEQCPDGTWICQIISNRRPRHEDEEPRVLQVVPVAGALNLRNITRYHPGVNVTAELAPARDKPGSQAEVLHVRLHGGYYVYGTQRADFQFLCDLSVDEPSSPSYSWTWNGTHTFQWRTKHACGSRLAEPVPHKDAPASDDDDDAGTPPPDAGDGDGDGSGEQELVNESPLHGRAVRSAAILLLSSCTAVATLAYLAWHPPACVRRFVKAHPRLGRFRVGERVLVRWAYEDLEMEEEIGYAGGEEDTMVNFGPPADLEEAGEGIPLKPSPRKGRWMSYGTA
ncbi:autophagy-related protein 27-domain-containing protein [Earliella scabrosa]|nr:autophagy-related protein 27-domain-containing protein [Earliella scabrosa]